MQPLTEKNFLQQLNSILFNPLLIKSQNGTFKQSEGLKLNCDKLMSI